MKTLVRLIVIVTVIAALLRRRSQPTTQVLPLDSKEEPLTGSEAEMLLATVDDFALELPQLLADVGISRVDIAQATAAQARCDYDTRIGLNAWMEAQDEDLS